MVFKSGLSRTGLVFCSGRATRYSAGHVRLVFNDDMEYMENLEGPPLQMMLPPSVLDSAVIRPQASRCEMNGESTKPIAAQNEASSGDHGEICAKNLSSVREDAAPSSVREDAEPSSKRARTSEQCDVKWPPTQARAEKIPMTVKKRPQSTKSKELVWVDQGTHPVRNQVPNSGTNNTKESCIACAEPTPRRKVMLWCCCGVAVVLLRCTSLRCKLAGRPNSCFCYPCGFRSASIPAGDIRLMYKHCALLSSFCLA